MSNPISPIAQAISEISKLLNKWISGTKGRRTRIALNNARLGLKRALKNHPDLKEDKVFMKYHNKFHKYIAIN